MCAAGGLGVLLLLPETKGRTLYEIQSLLGARRACPCLPHAATDADDADELSRPISAQELLDEAQLSGLLKRRTSSALVLAS